MSYWETVKGKTMSITSPIYFYVVTKVWKWPLWRALPLVGVFLFFDLSYFGANLFKLFQGGWFPIVIAGMVMVAMTTWKEGRAQLNFSQWGTYPSRKRVALLEKMCDEVREGGMPLKQYLWLHRDATLSEADWKSVCDWSTEEADRLAGSR